MEHYFLSSDAKPIYKEKSVLVKEFIPKEPIIQDLKVLPGLVYKNCLVVYEQGTKEFHVYKSEDWVSFESTYGVLKRIGFEPLSKRYPFYAQESEKDISREELEQEARKIIEGNRLPPYFNPFKTHPFGTPSPLDFDIFGKPFGLDEIKNRIEDLLPPTPKEENKEKEQPEDTELSQVLFLLRGIRADLNTLLKREKRSSTLLRKDKNAG